MSQHRLAEVSGISVATIRMLQRGAGGRRARDDTLAALSRALDWPGDHLLRVLLGEQPADVAGSRPGAIGVGKRRSGQAENRRENGRATDAAGGTRAGRRVAGGDGEWRSLAAVAEDLSVVVELLADLLDRLADLPAVRQGCGSAAGEDAVSDVGSEGCLFGVVSFADPGHTRALAVCLPFESPSAARAYARRQGLAHSLVSPLAFDTTADAAVDGAVSNGQDDAAETATELVVARAG
ncbi:helix-turn-helix transcriptional regulator [Pseudofrankia sp. BMG5.36]|uniref:helix-turn-helix domain-containing protein n=1 Tax=Pseudofrankia sp. BMG5.36 TaxID=1834512 RepID=UPI0008D92CEA|nr:hypothetical protein BCD48_34855 [Pseudofrankia sp. BMG5.36]